MSEPPFWHPLLTVWVDRVDAEWRRSRVGDAQREAMRRDLVEDLAQARLAGASLGALTGVDPAQFARDVADAYSVDRARASIPRRWPRATALGAARFRMVVAALSGAVAGGALALVTVYPFGLAIADGFVGSGTGEWLSVLLVHVAAACLAALCGSLGVLVEFRSRVDASRLAAWAGVGLLGSGAVVTVVTVAFAWSTGFQSRSSVLLVEVGIVLVGLVAGLMLLTHRVLQPGR